MLSEYQKFVKDHFHKMPGATPQQKMKACAMAYKAKHGSKTKPQSGRSKPRGKRGAGLFSDIGHGVDSVASIFGL